jgi:hypothetical protein
MEPGFAVSISFSPRLPKRLNAVAIVIPNCTYIHQQLLTHLGPGIVGHNKILSRSELIT